VPVALQAHEGAKCAACDNAIAVSQADAAKKVSQPIAGDATSGTPDLSALAEAPVFLILRGVAVLGANAGVVFAVHCRNDA
jgi:hypothetical protein